ncbi:MFS general substrate transporter [Gloeophyllum trabeum ATCC 11539]|uniref:MFS general substrate transporter n=1 Tax=Gloeophyllum trabeum (strain ATCC 11539 / FP-39264 / Madison 617) TaxID=670483 RepID=S7PTL0_GLOTA|nr:MFS general substrate transporter [Gloeophyllum trabeum ATCC 11539]EPQ51106.1 MFS general substrate transporter [Gloeophyllum trabeum ATCC 11539]
MPEWYHLKTLKPPSVETVTWAARQPLPPSTSTVNVSVNEATEPDRRDSESLADNSINGTTLAPVDRGFGAWSFLVAAFFVQAIVWGFPNSSGVFLASYLNDPRFNLQKDSSSLLPFVGTLSSGIIYCSGKVIPSSVVNQLIILQGVIYAIGGSLLWHPCISYMSEWFVARRGLANGMMFAGTSIAGLFLPLILPSLLNRFGAPSTLRILSIVILGMLIPLLPFVKGRLPESRVHGPNARLTDWSWTRNRVFWLVLAVNTIQGFAYFVPIIWLPTFAMGLRVNGTDSALPVALLNGGSVFGRLVLGILADRYNPWVLGSMTCISISLATFVLWGVLSDNIAALITYGIAYGGLAGGWSSLWTGFIRPIAKDDPTLSTYIYGLLMFSRGFGNVVSTPISTSLSRGYPPNAMNGKTGFDVAGGRFEKMIVYVGTCFASAAVVALAGWAVEKSGPRRT